MLCERKVNKTGKLYIQKKNCCCGKVLQSPVQELHCSIARI